jgi:hypothetical protein
MTAVGAWSGAVLCLALAVAVDLLREWRAKGWRAVWREEKTDTAGVVFGLMFAAAIWWLFFGVAVPVML